MKSILLSLSSFGGLAHIVNGSVITAPAQPFVLHEKLEHLPTGWRCNKQAGDSEVLNLRIALAHPHQDYLALAENISDPSRPQYGQFLSAEELHHVLPDTSLASESTIAWLERHSITDYIQGYGWIDFTTTAGTTRKMLNSQFSSYSFLDETPVLRTESYSLPEDVRDHIDFIYPTIHFFADPRSRRPKMLSARQHIPTGPANCSNSVCPNQLKKKYNINYRPADNKSGSQIGITGFLDNFPNYTDYTTFLSKYVNDKAPPKYAVEIIAKGVTKAPNGALSVEPLLDLEYSVAFTGPLPVTFYTTGGRGTQLMQPGNKPVPTTQAQNEPYLEFLQHVLAQKSPPQVISISYSDDEQSVPTRYAQRVCNLFAQAAMRGISVIGSSGDGGASGTGGDSSCTGPDGHLRFIPTFPSSCPWITSVGATASFGGAASFSSGGFSNVFARPSWQANATQAYFAELHGAHRGFYNASGRGIPDVSLLGDAYLVLSGGFPSAHDGTSASTPVFAAMIALINDLRLRAGKPVLGFLNPLLYSAKLRGVFRDVQDGSTSIGCANGNTFEAGWAALKGWDAVTGLGEPDFAKLRAQVA